MIQRIRSITSMYCVNTCVSTNIAASLYTRAGPLQIERLLLQRKRAFFPCSNHRDCLIFSIHIRIISYGERKDSQS
jgi:hypothetical protein